jgi:hypothetical protein
MYAIPIVYIYYVVNGVIMILLYLLDFYITILCTIVVFYSYNWS